MFDKQKKNRPDLALDFYIDTIGYLNPNYVINKYLDLQNMHFLTKYLEKLVNTKSHKTDVIINKDFIPLLINCYMKLGKNDQIIRLLSMHGTILQTHLYKESDPLVEDIRVIIEQCRLDPDTLDLAQEIASKTKNYNLLVQILTENKKDYV